MFQPSETQLREAARTLCLERGLDPDRLVKHNGKRVPQWTLQAQEVKGTLEILGVINTVFLEGTK
jgi:hypothetical protein